MMTSLACKPLLRLLQLLLAVAAVPQFEVDLDAPPESRFVQITKHYKAELLAMHNALAPMIKSMRSYSSTSEKEWLGLLDDGFLDEEFKAEEDGIANVLGYSKGSADRKHLRLAMLLYELGSPTVKFVAEQQSKKGSSTPGILLSNGHAEKGCSGVLWAARNGTVLHGRNMDYSMPFQMPDGTKKNWADVTHDIIFFKDKKPLFRSTAWPGGMGVVTGMRFDGWTFEQQTRPGFEDADANFRAGKEGGLAFALFARKLLQTVPDFATARDSLWNAKFMAPQYFVLSGPGDREGAVLSVDRLGKHLATSPPMLQLSEAPSWHLVQTNDDETKPALDERRPIATRLLSLATQDIVTLANLEAFMHMPKIRNNLTVFTTVMCVKTGFYKTLLHDEGADPMTGPYANTIKNVVKVESFLHRPSNKTQLSLLEPSSRTQPIQRRKLLFKTLG